MLLLKFQVLRHETSVIVTGRLLDILETLPYQGTGFTTARNSGSDLTLSFRQTLQGDPQESCAEAEGEEHTHEVKGSMKLYFHEEGSGLKRTVGFAGLLMSISLKPSIPGFSISPVFLLDN
eukprot:582992-Hanusia_phi.AAC.6